MYWIPDSSEHKQFPAHKRPNGKETFNTRWSRHGDSTITGGLQKINEKMDSNPNGDEKYG
jgi:hypothetical protein